VEAQIAEEETNWSPANLCGDCGVHSRKNRTWGTKRIHSELLKLLLKKVFIHMERFGY